MIKDFVLSFLQSRFVQNVFFLQSSTGVILVVNLATSIAVVRTLGPENYGQYAVILAVYNTAGLFVNWGLVHSLVTLLSRKFAERDEEEFNIILAYYMKIVQIMLICVMIPAFILLPFIGHFFYRSYFVGLMAGILLLGVPLLRCYGIGQVFLLGTAQIKPLAFLETLMEIAKALFLITSALVFGRIEYLVAAQIAAEACMALSGLTVFNRYRKRLTIRVADLRTLLKMSWHVKRSRILKFSLLIAWDKNMGNFLSAVPILIAGSVLLPAQVGFFKLALSFVKMPAVAFNGIVRNLEVKLPELIGKRALMRMKQNFYKVFFLTGIFGLGISVALFFLAPLLIPLIYGAAFRPSVGITRILLLYLVILGFSANFGALYRALDKMPRLLISKGLALVFLPAGYWLMTQHGTDGAAWFVVLLFAASGLFMIAISIIDLNRAVKMKKELTDVK